MAEQSQCLLQGNHMPADNVHYLFMFACMYLVIYVSDAYIWFILCLYCISSKL